MLSLACKSHSTVRPKYTSYTYLQGRHIAIFYYYSMRDSAQNGVYGKKVMMSLQPVRSNESFEHTYFGMKKESGEQKKSTVLKITTPLDPRNNKNSKRNHVAFAM